MEKFTYINAQNMAYVDDLFQSFLQNPESVDPNWRMFFEGVEFAKKIGGGSYSAKELKVFELIQGYRKYGHRKAKLDPLQLAQRDYTELDYKSFGLDEKDLSSSFEVAGAIGMKGARLSEVIDYLEKTYCSTITVDFADCNPDVQRWIIKEFETNSSIGAETKKSVLKELTKTEALEKFIQTRFVGAKRFSIEGADALMPVMEHLLRIGADQGMQELVIGMAHRGRVNMLVNFCEKPADLVFSEFEGTALQNQGYAADGDVKYHMGFSVDRDVSGKKVHVSMAYNPSHLEAVNPVVCGMAKAKQKIRQDQDKNFVVPVLVHGDAAFIGQGVVAETLQLSQLNGFSVGGTIHIVTNNQVGFTTNPESSRSSTYCTDVAKALHAPVFHVNGDDVENCLRTLELAFKYRQNFKSDIVIDIVCYRRFGHNEADEPAYTQPLMYKVIKDHATLREIYAKKLGAEGLVTEAESTADLELNLSKFQEALDRSRKEALIPKFFTLEGQWKGIRRPNSQDYWQKLQALVKKYCKVWEIVSPLGLKPFLLTLN